ncbi:hypothetical protein [Deinococcus soli (ex Cha et al. 2016)]|uniref:Uncharacterized protein n=2 Tax=Deinococcus soli (ex Cha et al. 2016) TaxID=1309411 RepID=A0ACC6KG39_9DEIO|nr:hypothetical protein [Deinococcus soli (ex Cha et al. 2016)]MDR6218490.1 hypothetical protein [Deinococcus soli (ex Cha et al. 2016)]MDR6329230.1 hypothetical protein [Deinococcus soli (ex Cha et al. 2016)]MDR6751503.1 hypothetical protein [Deinococcus soli (ex Cha et al. 2016)]
MRKFLTLALAAGSMAFAMPAPVVVEAPGAPAVTFGSVPTNALPAGYNSFLVPNYQGTGGVLLIQKGAAANTPAPFFTLPPQLNGLTWVTVDPTAKAAVVTSTPATQTPTSTVQASTVQPSATVNTATSVPAVTVTPAATAKPADAASTSASVTAVTAGPELPATGTPPAPVVKTPAGPVTLTATTSIANLGATHAMPDWLSGRFFLIPGNKPGVVVIGYSLSNRDRTRTAITDPAGIVITQNGQSLEARLDRRNSSREAGSLKPLTGEYGTITVYGVTPGDLNLHWDVTGESQASLAYEWSLTPTLSAKR